SDLSRFCNAFSSSGLSLFFTCSFSSFIPFFRWIFHSPLAWLRSVTSVFKYRERIPVSSFFALIFLMFSTTDICMFPPLRIHVGQKRDSLHEKISFHIIFPLLTGQNIYCTSAASSVRFLEERPVLSSMHKMVHDDAGQDYTHKGCIHPFIAGQRNDISQDERADTEAKIER